MFKASGGKGCLNSHSRYFKNLAAARYKSIPSYKTFNTNIISKTTDQNYLKIFFRVFRIFGQISAYFSVLRATKMNLGLFRVFMVVRVR